MLFYCEIVFHFHLDLSCSFGILDAFSSIPKKFLKGTSPQIHVYGFSKADDPELDFAKVGLRVLKVIFFTARLKFLIFYSFNL